MLVLACLTHVYVRCQIYRGVNQAPNFTLRRYTGTRRFSFARPHHQGPRNSETLSTLALHVKWRWPACRCWGSLVPPQGIADLRARGYGGSRPVPGHVPPWSAPGSGSTMAPSRRARWRRFALWRRARRATGLDGTGRGVWVDWRASRPRDVSSWSAAGTGSTMAPQWRAQSMNRRLALRPT